MQYIVVSDTEEVIYRYTQNVYCCISSSLTYTTFKFGARLLSLYMLISKKKIQLNNLLKMNLCLFKVAKSYVCITLPFANPVTYICRFPFTNPVTYIRTYVVTYLHHCILRYYILLLIYRNELTSLYPSCEFVNYSIIFDTAQCVLW